MNFNDFLGNKREYRYGKITQITPAADNFLREYRTDAVKYGTVLEQGIQNPIPTNIQYCSNLVSVDFQNDVKYIKTEMKKLLEKANSGALTMLAQSIYNEFCILKQNGKNDNVIRNTFIKFMCWFKFDFANTMYYLNSPFTPKVLYYGTVKHYEALFLKILHNAGCFIVVVYTGNDGAELDDVPEIQFSGSAQPAPQPVTSPPPMNNFSQSAPPPAPKPITSPPPMSFPQTPPPAPKPVTSPPPMNSFSPTVQPSAPLRPEDIKIKAKWHSCTNVWAKHLNMENILKDSRGTDSSVYYNCFIQVNGVNSKADYLSNLMQFYRSIKSRRHIIIDKEIPAPTGGETAQYNIPPANTPEAIIKSLANCLPDNTDLNRQIKSVFIDFMLEDAKTSANASIVKNNGVHILCYLTRYRKALFDGWKYPETAVFIFMGAVTNKKTALFLDFLSQLPVDVLVLRPDLNTTSVLEGKMLADINYSDSLAVECFPTESTRISIGTTAYHAEKEINQMMTENSVIFTNRQYQKAVSVQLRTMYEEIHQLWNEELKFRPSFSADDDGVVLPVIFTKVSGVKDGDASQYWKDIKKLIGEDTFVVRKAPFIQPKETPNKWFYLSNGILRRDAIKMNTEYRYGILRNEVQEHIFDSIQRVIDSKIMKGTPDHKIVDVILSLDMTLINMIQNFDFTKKNPKIICILTDSNAISEEDAIMFAFLSTAGFDVVFFVPTGYQTAEKFYADGVLNEHQNGDYMYNLSVPDFHVKSANPKLTLKEKLFGRK